MRKTIAFVTNQYSSERIIKAAEEIAKNQGTQLEVIAIQDNKYELNPQAVDFLFHRSKVYGASMRLIFHEHAPIAMHDIIEQPENQNIVTGMPSTSTSIIYDLWKEFFDKNFFVVDLEGEITEVANSKNTADYACGKLMKTV